LTLGNSTFSCSGSCNAVFQNFQGPGYKEFLTGFLDPKDTEFRLFGEGKGHFGGKLKDMQWSQNVPDAPAMAELLCVLLLLGLMIPGARVLRRQN
jgi:hypothetical protein